MVSEMTPDTATATLTHTANSRNSRPMIPPISSTGMNTAISDTVIDTMVKPISRAPAMVASRRALPISR